MPEKEAYYSIYDSAMMWGDCCFEMQRTFKKRTFKLHEHIQRLMTSLKILEIDIPYSWKHLTNEHENLLLHNRKCFKDDDEIRSLINVSRGILPIYQDLLNDDGKPNVMMACFPLRAITKSKFDIYAGIHMIVPSQRAIPHYLLDARIKSRSRQHYKLADLEIAKQDKNAYALLLDTNGYIAEGTGSNFFIVSNNNFELYTPKPINCLKGISRNYIMELARKLGMEIFEKDITLHDVYTAREAFITNTPYCIIPVTRVNYKPIDEGRVGKRTKYLTQKWQEDVNCDFVSQVRGWNNV